MKCPICVDKKMKSCVYNLGSYSTSVAYTPYYDEEGEYHDHDGNWNTQNFSCSMGHKWSETSRRSCPSCDWGKDEVTKKIHIQKQEENNV